MTAIPPPVFQRTFLSVLLGLTIATSSFSRVHAQSAVPIPEGNGFQLKNEDMTATILDKAQDAGVGFVRKGIYWSNIETSQGVYDWTEVDAWIASMESRGFSMLITVVWNNRIYEDIWDRAIVTEPGRQAFAGFAADLVDRYQGKNIIWEIWNEPNLRSFWHENAENKSNTDAMAEEYTALVQVAVPAMKAADPNCVVVAGSISALWSQSFSWFERCVEVGILTSGIDGISVHPYGFQWPELAVEGYAEIEQILADNGTPYLPLVNSEVGYSEAWLLNRGFATAEIEDVQAWQYVRQNLVDAMSGVQATIWYEMTASDYGVLNTNGSERPTFVAAQVMTSQLAGYSFKERLPLSSPLDYAVVFENENGDRKLVAWTTPDKSLPVTQRQPVAHGVDLPVGVSGSYDVVDIFGNVTPLTAATTDLSVTLKGAPQYIPLASVPTGYANVALGKTATVSSGSGADKLTDGLYTTNSRWMAAYGYPQWVEVDLAGQFLVDRVTLEQHANRADDFSVEIWNGVAWVTVAQGSANAAHTVEANFTPTMAEKIRFNITSGDYYLKVFEIEVYGDAYVPPVVSNVALDKPVTTSSGGSSAAKLTDGLFTTNSRWFSDYGYPQWAEVNLGSDHTIHSVLFSQHAERTDDCEVQVWNGTTWVAVATVTGNADLDIAVAFAPVTTDRVRFVVTSGSLYLKVYEFEVFGFEN